MKGQPIGPNTRLEKNPHADEDKGFGGVNPASSTSFKDVQPYEGNVDIVAAGYKTNARMAPSAHVPIDLKTGEGYTVVIAGGTRKSPREAIKIDDHLSASSSASR